MIRRGYLTAVDRHDGDGGRASKQRLETGGGPPVACQCAPDSSRLAVISFVSKGRRLKGLKDELSQDSNEPGAQDWRRQTTENSKGMDEVTFTANRRHPSSLSTIGCVFSSTICRRRRECPKTRQHARCGSLHQVGPHLQPAMGLCSAPRPWWRRLGSH